MKKNLHYLFFALLWALITVQKLSAQTKTHLNTLQAPPPGVKIDGDLKDWGDSLRYYNEDKKLYFSLANSKDTLYMAIRFSDKLDQRRILSAGLTLSINTRGKEKESFSLTFPEVERGTMGGYPRGMPQGEPGDGNITQADRDELAKEKLTKLRNIKVKGFEKDIETDVITTTNTYGIKTAINYDENGYLIYEAAVPLRFFHEDKPEKYLWAFNFKVNGITRPSGGGGGRPGGGEGMGEGGGMGGMGGGGGRRGGSMGGMGGGGGGRRGGSMGGAGGARGGEGGPAGNSELSKSFDFWAKYYLAI